MLETKKSLLLKWISRLFLPVFFLSLMSCRKDTSIDFPLTNVSMDTIPNVSSADTGIVTYLALGDSYTIGESVLTDERFPVQLAAILRKQNLDVTSPDIIAVTGWTTANLINALSSDPPGKNYSFVTLLIGVNNQYQGRSLDEYKLQFAQLLNKAIAYAGNDTSHVFVLSIPDYSVTPFAAGYDRQKIAKEIDEFNAANKTISFDANVHYIDITPISRQAQSDPSLIAADGLHPSDLQYLKWDEVLAPFIVKQFGR